MYINLGEVINNSISLLYTAVELSNSSEVANSDDLKKYISEPRGLVVMEAKDKPFEVIRTSWLSMSVRNQRTGIQNNKARRAYNSGLRKIIY